MWGFVPGLGVRAGQGNGPLKLCKNVQYWTCEIAETSSEDGASASVSPHTAKINWRQAERSEESRIFSHFFLLWSSWLVSPTLLWSKAHTVRVRKSESGPGDEPYCPLLFRSARYSPNEAMSHRVMAMWAAWPAAFDAQKLCSDAWKRCKSRNFSGDLRPVWAEEPKFLPITENLFLNT